MTYINKMKEREFPDKVISLTGWFVVILALSNVFLSSYAVTVLSLLYLFYYLAASKYALPQDLMKYLIIPLVLISVGVAGSMGNIFYDVLKDGWYFVNPLLVFCAGYLAMRRVKQIEQLLKLFVVCGFILALAPVFTILSEPSLLFEATAKEIHEEKIGGSFLTLISFSILLSIKKPDIVLFTSPHKKIFIPIILLADAFSLFLSFSRTLWVSLALFILAQRGYFTFKRLKGLLTSVIILAAFLSLVMIAPDNMRSQSTMTGKILNSLDEVLIKDYYSKSDIANHWRGYESYMAFNTFLNGTPINYIVGQGFGALVDLKTDMKLGGETFRFIPIMHNGYMYLLVKTGVAGLLLYFAYIVTIMKTGLRYSNYQDERLVFSGQVIVACALILLFTTLVISGMFNKAGLVPILFLLGMSLSHVRMRSIEVDDARKG